MLKRPAGREDRRGAPEAAGEGGERTRARVLAPCDWPSFFGSIACGRDHLVAAVALLHDGAAEQTGHAASRGDRLRSIGYDGERDLLELAVGGIARAAALRYFIRSPQRVSVDQRARQLTIVVRDASGARTVIRIERAAVLAGGVSRVPAGTAAQLSLAPRPAGRPRLPRFDA